MAKATGDENNEINSCRKFTCYRFLEDVYIAKDPFSPTGEGIFLFLGGHCSLCKNVVCQAEECSIFFSKRFCLSCAEDNSSQFLPE
ncbi:cysteine-rich DPF motif domain-containing protein 1 isoform X2 [Tachypleus tridentatus]|uniref:cysteine-rich DPF motif domain-containing protein 1 isoform X2 n=1 Tax=Tachypleus tridentatus TaxID=6853 RepID=UPI003FCFD6EC